MAVVVAISNLLLKTTHLQRPADRAVQRLYFARFYFDDGHGGFAEREIGL